MTNLLLYKHWKKVHKAMMWTYNTTPHKMDIQSILHKLLQCFVVKGMFYYSRNFVRTCICERNEKYNFGKKNKFKFLFWKIFPYRKNLKGIAGLLNFSWFLCRMRNSYRYSSCKTRKWIIEILNWKEIFQIKFLRNWNKNNLCENSSCALISGYIHLWINWIYFNNW